jgi:hypothetical protein
MRQISLFYILLLFACKENSKQKLGLPNPVITKFKETEAHIPYDSMKKQIFNTRKKMSFSSTQNFLKEAELSFVSTITDSLFPYWYGTAWDFNGITQQPQKGAIACGYFVSTILRDAGVKIDRVKMGQCESQKVIHNYATKKDTKVFYDVVLDTALNFVRTKGKGLYIIGLDAHVGFLWYNGDGIWFVHSKWFSPRAVVKEMATQSSVLQNSKYRIIGKISSNEKLLREWLWMK